MAITATWGNRGKYDLMRGNIDFDGHTFKIILMNNTFTFNKDTHHGYADVSASELAAGNGYTTGGQTLSGVSIAEDDANDYAQTTWSNVLWSASGGSIGPSKAAIIFDDTATDDPIIGAIEFGGSQTVINGGAFMLINITVRLI